ncbi:DNA-binding response regulator [Clostridium botulinum]|uniref:helix-turn-helix domain-containing protein n=1 Tax=Clostridium botulinum TaxID=1491 RepID=UPI0005009866|nr:replication protein [Clostridium botulinum]MBN1072730.1 DNA-binding response regulator [Clostridium botulinum]MBY6780790.1 DNA-binding response regulator [Clostridium botulinum]MBY6853972.1 DNA-binding response regulator [Clostridium botulinum]
MGQVLRQQEYNEPIEYLNTVHGTSKGWITRAEVSSSFNQWHYKYNDLVKQDFTGENNYISLNTFYSTYRRLEYLKELKAHFIDLDIYKTKFTKEQVLMRLDEEYFNKSIPRPNLIIDSGRGLYLIWMINSVPSQALPLWKAVEEYLYKELKVFGADRQALDATRVLRVPGSINSKSNTVVEVLEQYEYVYDLREIQEGYLPELDKSKPKKKGRPSKTVFIHRERSLYYARIQDIIKLCELRNYDLKGQRELILFLYRYWLCYFTEDTQKALEDILELNNQFVLPLSKTEVIRATRSAERVFLSKDKRYKYKNKTLIDLLEIIELEETYMKTIISDKEYKRRQNNAFRKRYQEKLKLDGKLTKKEQINIQRQKIKALLEQGFTQKDISKELNIPSRTIERRVKELRTLQEIV